MKSLEFNYMKNRSITNLVLNRKSHRFSRGSSLVEVLIATLLSAVLAGLFLDLISQLLRLHVTSQNEFSANAVAQEMIETSKALGYSFLSANQGTYILLINRDSTGGIGPYSKQDPVLIDFFQRNWSALAQKSKFTGNATLEVKPANGLSNALLVAITVKWADGKNIAGRPVQASTLLTEAGEDKWAK